MFKTLPILLIALAPVACVKDVVSQDLDHLTQVDERLGRADDDERREGRALVGALLRYYGHYLYLQPEPEADDCKLCIRVLSDSAFTDYLNGIAARLAPADRPSVVVLDVEEHLALALPGRYVVVSFGALKAAEDPDEVAGLLALELAHAENRTYEKKIDAALAPTKRQLTRQNALRLSVRALLKSTNDQASERAAAERAVVMLKNAGFDAAAYYSYLQSLGTIREPVTDVMDQIKGPRATRLQWYRDALAKARLPLPRARRPDNRYLKWWETLRRGTP